MSFDRLKGREFIALLGGAAGWPLAARGQQGLPIIGYLGSGTALRRIAGFLASGEIEKEVHELAGR